MNQNQIISQRCAEDYDDSYYVIIYKTKNGQQIEKPYEDDENGTLLPVALLTVFCHPKINNL